MHSARIWLYQWIKTNSVILLNAGSLAGTTVVTAGLGFAYWWMAAHLFSQQAVGLASALISAMMLLGNAGVLGLGTLLVGELPRWPQKATSLISAAVIFVGCVGGITGIIFALLAPFVSTDFQVLRMSLGNILWFSLGVSLTAVTIVLDQAFIGLLRGDIQFWRNALFAGAKLVLLVGFGLYVMRNSGMAIYAAWTLGNMCSLVVLAGLGVAQGHWAGTIRLPDWQLLRKLGRPALQHHLLNLVQQIPTLALPILVTMLLSATTNAWFYVAWMITGFVFVSSYALTTVLYAVGTTQYEVLAHKLRMTLMLAVITSALGNCILQFWARPILALFGPAYVLQAMWSLRILSLGAFPMIIKYHYIAVCRIRNWLSRALLPIVAGSCLELTAAAVGAIYGGLSGLSLGWVIAVCIEAVWMFRPVHEALRSKNFMPEKAC